MRRTDLLLRIFAILLLASVPLPFLPFPGTSDVGSFWLPWMHNVAELGVVKGYAASGSDYPPGCVLVLAWAVRAAAGLGIDHFTALKLSILAFLWATTLCVWLWTRRLALAAGLLVALLLESVAHGYVDVYFAPFLLGALWALQKGRTRTFAVCFTVACLIKWQPLVLAPILLVFLLRNTELLKWRPAWRPDEWRALARDVVLPAALLAATVLLIFGQPVLDALTRALSNHFLSGDAFNFSWIVTHWIRVTTPEAFGGLTDGRAEFIETEDLSYTLLPKLLFALFYIVTLLVSVRKMKRFGDVLRFCLVGYLAYFTFNTGVHENHLFLAVLLAVMLYAEEGAEAFAPAAAVVILANLNLLLFYGIEGTGYRFSRLLFGVDMALLFSIVVVLLFIALFADAVMRPSVARTNV